MRRADKFLLLAIISLAAYFVISIIIPGIASPIVLVYNWFLDFSLLLGYSGDLLISFIGNATVLFPFPYMGVTFILGGLTDEMTGQFLFDPWLVGLLSGFGAMLGEMISYFVGYGGGQLIEENQRDAFRKYVERHPKATPFVLWFLAVTPFPDDVLIVPLGAARYPWWKVMMPQFLGKTMFMIGVAWSGRIGLDFIGSLIGSTDPTSIISRAIEVSSVLLIIIAIYFLVTINWSMLIPKEEDKDQ
ncbi:MAG: VTT domain-containing protein [Candidatus Thorarchaeota archaeon]|nr:VTT domain-containing protein [Candidatus Thorarchaeota archaeon]